MWSPTTGDIPCSSDKRAFGLLSIVLMEIHKATCVRSVHTRAYVAAEHFCYCMKLSWFEFRASWSTERMISLSVSHRVHCSCKLSPLQQRNEPISASCAPALYTVLATCVLQVSKLMYYFYLLFLFVINKCCCCCPTQRWIWCLPSFPWYSKWQTHSYWSLCTFYVLYWPWILTRN